MCGGLAMFLLVAIFKMVGRRRNPYDAAPGPSPALNDFIARKKALALALTLCLVVIVLYQVGTLGLDGLRVFYTNLFTLMIFTDVLVLTLSMLVTDRYELVFRNAAFVASTIMIRASLTTDHPYNVPIALIAMAFGIITVVVYNYHSHLPAEEPVMK